MGKVPRTSLLYNATKRLIKVIFRFHYGSKNASFDGNRFCWLIINADPFQSLGSVTLSKRVDGQLELPKTRLVRVM